MTPPVGPDEVEAVIRTEVCYAIRRSTVNGALEPDDLWQVARIAAWQATQELAATRARVRIGVRRAVRDALRAEFRAQGSGRATVRWPVYWPRDASRARYRYEKPKVLRRYCRECGVFVEQARRQRCDPCQQARRAAQQRMANADYWRRTHPAAAA